MKKSRSVFCLTAFLTLSVLPVATQADCDLEHGENQYNKCIACHSVEADTHLMGNSLHGLMGRKAGTAEGFTFSPAMEEADFIWTKETLKAFLENPRQYVPGNSMPFGRITNGGQLEALVCYIEQLQ